MLTGVLMAVIHKPISKILFVVNKIEAVKLGPVKASVRFIT